MSRSFIYTANTNAQTVAEDGVVQPGSIIRRFGCNLNLNGDAVSVFGDGYYDLDAIVVAEPVAAGAITATLYENGVPIPGATASTTATAASPVTLPIIGAVRKTCCGGVSSITCVLSGAATVTNYAFRAERK